MRPAWHIASHDHRAAQADVLSGVLPLVLLVALAACGGHEERASEPIVVRDVRRLIDDVQGFARGTTGGAAGPVVWVTTLADAGSGSLREAVAGADARWVRFRVSGDLPLATPLYVGADKTIDGRGVRVRITGEGLVVQASSNVIIENLVFEHGRDDALRLENAAHHVWVDHCSFATWEDGLIDVIRASTDVTVSWCRFSEHDKVMLLSASPQATGDRVMRVTLHHNYFRGTDERHPRLRFGKVHAYNNLYEAWRSYGIAASMYGEVFSQANIFDAGWLDREAIVTQKGRDPAPGYVRSVGDVVTGGAHIEVREPERVFDPTTYYPTTGIEPADDRLRAAVRAGAGWRDVRVAEAAR